MKNALFRLSKYSGDKNVFNDYTINALQQTASQMDGYLNYACALGGQNGIPTLVSYADHTIHAIARRTGIQYSYAIIAMLLERLGDGKPRRKNHRAARGCARLDLIAQPETMCCCIV